MEVFSALFVISNIACVVGFKKIIQEILEFEKDHAEV